MKYLPQRLNSVAFVLSLRWKLKNRRKNTHKLYCDSKIQLFGPQEKAVFTPGDRYASFQFRGHHIGLLICYVIEFAQHAWALKARGVDLVLVPTANPAGFENVSDLIVPARAACGGGR